MTPNTRQLTERSPNNQGMQALRMGALLAMSLLLSKPAMADPKEGLSGSFFAQVSSDDRSIDHKSINRSIQILDSSAAALEAMRVRSEAHDRLEAAKKVASVRAPSAMDLLAPRMVRSI